MAGGVVLSFPELCEQFEFQEFYPNLQVLKYLKEATSTGEADKVIVGLDWSGIEQITDKFFLLACDEPFQFVLEHVTMVSLRGCRYISDTSLHCLTTITPNVEMVLFDGCPNISEAGLLVLGKKCTKLQHVSLTATSVTFIPTFFTEEPASKIQLVLDGCPLINPPPDVENKDSSMCSQRKVIVHAMDEGLSSIAEFLTSGEFVDYDVFQPHKISLFEDTSITGIDEKVTIFECHGGSITAAPFVSERALHLLVIDVDITGNPQVDIMGMVNSVRGEVGNVPFAVVLMHQHPSLTHRQLAAGLGVDVREYFKKQDQALRGHVQSVSAASLLESSTELDFLEQQQAVRSARSIQEQEPFYILSIVKSTKEVEQHWPEKKLQVDREGVAKKAESIKSQMQAEYAKFEPEWQSALTSLNNLSKADLAVLKSMKSPPVGVIYTFACVGRILGMRVDQGPSRQLAAGPSTSIVKLLLADFRIINRLQEYSFPRLSAGVMKELSEYVQIPGMTVEKLRNVSSATEAFWKWVLAVYTYEKEHASKILVLKAELESVETLLTTAGTTNGLIEMSPSEVSSEVGRQIKSVQDSMAHKHQAWIVTYQIGFDICERDIHNLVSMEKHPEAAVKVMKAVAILFGKQPTAEAALELMNGAKDSGTNQFVNSLKKYEKYNIPQSVIDSLEKEQKKGSIDLEVTFEDMEDACKECSRLHVWVVGIYKFATDVIPEVQNLEKVLKGLRKDLTFTDTAKADEQVGKLHEVLALLLGREKERDELQHHQLPFSAQFQRVQNTVKALKGEKVISLESFLSCPELSGGDPLPEWFSDKSIEVAVKHLHIMGELLYFPNVDGNPIVTDLKWFVEMTNHFLAFSNNNATVSMESTVVGPETEIYDRDQAFNGSASENQITILESIWKEQGLLLSFPTGRPAKTTGEMLLCPSTRLGLKFFVRTSANYGKYSDYYFSSNHWPDWGLGSILDITSHVGLDYDITVGMPIKFWYRLFRELFALGTVLLVSQFAIKIRCGAVEIFIRNSVHAVYVSERIKIEARLDLDKEKVPIEQRRQYIWSVLSDVLLIVEYHLHRYPNLHYHVKYVCPGQCAKAGEGHEFTLQDIKQATPTSPLKCPRCTKLNLPLKETQLLLGRQYAVMHHDFVELNTSSLSAKNQFVLYPWTYEAGCLSQDIFVCGHCGIRKEDALRLWHMHTTLYPSFAESLVENSTGSVEMSGNILQENRPKHAFVKSSEMDGDENGAMLVMKGTLKDCCRGGRVEVVILKMGALQLVLDQEEYFTSNSRDSQTKSEAATVLDLKLGKHHINKTDDWPVEPADIAGLVCKAGDKLSFEMRSKELDSAAWEKRDLETFILKKNGFDILELELHKRTHLGFCLKSSEKEQPSLILYCPACPVIQAHHFPLGSALLYRMEANNQWALGQVLSVARDKLIIGHNYDSSSVLSIPPSSEFLLPVECFTQSITVFCGPDVIKKKGQIISYLEEQNAFPAPLSLFPDSIKDKDKMNLSSSFGLDKEEPKLCLVNRNSPQAIRSRYQRCEVPRMLSECSSVGRVLLPAALDERLLLFHMSAMIQSWKQSLHSLCRAARLGDKPLMESHFVGLPGRIMSSKEKERLWTKYLDQMLFDYYLLSSCEIILPDWRLMVPEVFKEKYREYESDLTVEEVNDLAHRLIDTYLASMLCMWALAPAGSNNIKDSDNADGMLSWMENSELVLNEDGGSRCVVHHDLDLGNQLPVAEDNILLLTVSVLSPKIIESDLLSLLPSIRVLDFSYCWLPSLEGITQLPSLTEIKAGRNCIKNLPEDFGCLARTLEVLDLGYNRLQTLPDVLCTFSRLQKLDVSHNYLTSLPEEIGSLCQLRTLLASNNSISYLPDSFSNLKNLRNLGLDGIEWPTEWINWPAENTQQAFVNLITHSSWLSYTSRIQPYESMSQQDVESLFNQADANRNGTLTAEETAELCRLIYDYFPRFKPTSEDPEGFPVQILGCHKLRRLSLRYQGFTTVQSGIKELPSLQSICLDFNPNLQVISDSLGYCDLQNVQVFACPKLKTPPAEIVSQGGQNVIAYLKRLSQGAAECYRTKLMFVGLGGAGKTSLMRALMSSTYKAPVIQGEGITDGIDISSWSIKRGNSPTITYSVWDFAGQTVYYNTHQFFLSKRAVYLLIWNTRLGYEHSGLDFWLSSIACHCPKAPIFIVGTHADQITKSELPRESLFERFPNIAGFHTISSVEGMGVEELLENLIQVTLKEPYIGERIPEAWLNFEQMVLQERKEQSILNWQQICESATKACIYDTEILQAVRFLHDLGTLQHFDNDFLRDRVVVNPQWIVDVMTCLISVHNQVIKDGRLKHSDIPVIWQDYPEELHDWLLRLTQVFDLTFPLEDKEESIVPCLLSQTVPEFTWPLKEKDSVEIKLLYRFEYLPAGLFNRAQVRLYQYCSGSLMWKHGAVLKKNGHIALIRQLQNAEVLVKVQGPCPQNVLLLIHEVYETLIADFYQGVKYEYLLPCTECMNMETNEPTMFSSRTLRRAIEMKSLFLQCHQFFHVLSMTDVQGHLLPQSGNDYDIQLQNAVRELSALEDDLEMDIFFLYCSKNLPEPGDSAIHPLRMKEDLESRGFKCVFVDDVEEKSVDDLAMTIKACKVMIVMISTEFAEDPQCQRLFSFAYAGLHKACVLAMVGKDRNWQKTQMGMQLVHKVFINFQKTGQYDTKLGELIKQLRELIREKITGLAKADVFLSYCWSNSATAVEEGRTLAKPGALGHGDPVGIKKFLESHGLVTWMDVERTGKTGLFEEIAEGMKQCKVVVACISDEYVLSQNCQMEFRFAHIALRKPIILAVVGTGFMWESTEIGMLSLGYTKINFQMANDIARSQLLESVKDTVAKCPNTSKAPDKKEIQFQELYELAQRKFLRQVASFTEGQDPFPRLFVADLSYDPQNPNDQGETRSDFSFTNLQPGDFCIKFLCEYEKGWHAADESLTVDLSGQDLATLWNFTAPYMARLLVILKHSNTSLSILRTDEGTKLIRALEKNFSQSVTSELHEVYMVLRKYLMAKDQHHTYGGLRRCHMPNGKIMWLCGEHTQNSHITAVNDGTPPVTSQTGNQLEHELLSNLREIKDRSIQHSQKKDAGMDVSESSRKSVVSRSRPSSVSHKNTAASDNVDKKNMNSASTTNSIDRQTRRKRIDLLKAKSGSSNNQMHFAAQAVAGNQTSSNACSIL